MLLFPSVAASSSLRGDFEFSTATINGQLATAASGPVALLAERGEVGTFRWSIRASDIEVAWTNATELALLSPPSFQRPLMRLATSPPDHDSRTFRDPVVTSESRSADSVVLLVPGPSGATIFDVAMRGLVLADQDRDWEAGPRGTRTFNGGSPSLSVDYDLPRDWVQAQITNATANLRGDFSVIIWETPVAIEAEGETTLIDSGRREERIAQAPDVAPARKTVSQVVTIRATNATFTIELMDADARFATPQLAVFGAGNAVFTETTGLVVGTEEATLAAETLDAAGSITLDVIIDPMLERFQGLLALKDGRLGTATGKEFVTIAEPDDGFRSWTVWPILGAVAVAFIVAWFWVSRSPVAIEEVEEAILNGKVGRGHALAAKLVRRRPQDADAVFLFGTTLMAREPPHRLLKRLEPLAAELPKPKRQGVAYLLAVAAKALGHAPTLRRWASEAAAEPLLRARMRQDGVWDEPEPKPTPKFQQSGYA